VTGIVGAAGGIGGFFLPNILGSLKELTGSYTFGFLTISLFVLIVFLCLVVSQFKRKKVLINHTISES